MSDAVEVWTDGAYNNTDDVGGWAFLVKVPGSPFHQLVSGAEPNTTSQRMEMKALWMALRHFEQPADLIVHTDSSYVKNGLVRKWYVKWRRNGWINSRGEPVANRHFWEALIKEVERHRSVQFVKVRGHSGIELNELVDAAAVRARREMAEEMKQAA